MNSNIIELPKISLEEALGQLKPYQKDTMLELISNFGEEGAAEQWISAKGPSGLEKFGGERNKSKSFWQNIRIEFNLLLCGDEKYTDIRTQINQAISKHSKTIIGIASTAIAASLGVQAALIAPVIAILIYLSAKIGVNAWCATTFTN